MASPITGNSQQPFASILVPNLDRTDEHPMSHTITAAAPNLQLSLDELRLRAYSVGRRPPAAQSKHFEVSPGPLTVTAPPETRGRNKYGKSIITFKIGSPEDEVDFTVHENVVTLASEFVRLALQRDWKENRTREICLSDVEPAVFETYQVWLYEQRIDLAYCPAADDPSRIPDLMVFILKLWVLGDRFLDVKFKDNVVDTLIAQIEKRSYVIPHVDLACFAYSHTPDGSAPRRLITDLYVHLGKESWSDEASNALEDAHRTDFWRDLSKAQFTLSRKTNSCADIMTMGSGIVTSSSHSIPASSDKYSTTSTKSKIANCTPGFTVPVPKAIVVAGARSRQRAPGEMVKHESSRGPMSRQRPSSSREGWKTPMTESSSSRDDAARRLLFVTGLCVFDSSFLGALVL
ncbi:hypothetical protein BST61_g7272 [Cercospora zeina]